MFRPNFRAMALLWGNYGPAIGTDFSEHCSQESALLLQWLHVQQQVLAVEAGSAKLDMLGISKNDSSVLLCREHPLLSRTISF